VPAPDRSALTALPQTGDGQISPAGDADLIEQRALTHAWPHGAELDWNELAARDGLLIFESARDSTLTDTRGRRYLDALAGLFVVNVGHGRREIGEAMARQASQLAYVSASRYTSVRAVEMAEWLASLAPGDLDRVFFCSGGSEAVETALKIARQAQALRGFPKRYKVVARRGSYHGMTYGAMSLTQIRSEVFHGPFAYGVSIVPSPNRYRNDFGLEGEDGDVMCAKYVEQEILAQGPETVAAVIGEPISASNGTHVPSPIYWQMLREICDRHGVLLIMDEVINGFGRTGRLFAAEHFGVVPDLMTVAKGLSSGYAPVGAVFVRPNVFESFTAPHASLVHLLTFGGNAVALAGARENVRIMLEEDLPARSLELGEYLRQRLLELSDHPTVGDVRGLGLLAGVELVRSKRTKENWGVHHPFVTGMAESLRSRSVLTRVWDTLHLAPPLVITKAEIDLIVEAVDESLTEREQEFAGEIEAADG
jgi:adenosylmethionine-8-amino-7-oxononanoate aminotransferase